MDIREIIRKEIEDLEQMAGFLKEKSVLYKGMTLQVTRHKNRGKEFYYRQSGSRKKTYIKKDDIALKEGLCRKCFADKALSIIEPNLTLLKNVLEELRPYSIEEIFNKMSEGSRELMESLKPTLNDDNVVQSKNMFMREELKYITQSGVWVRTKSEVFICNALNSYGIKVGYEQPLKLISYEFDSKGRVIKREKTIYPDFIIYMPDGSLFIWEHMGLLNKTDYKNKAIDKLMLYYDNGYRIPTNLIITTEGPTMPFDEATALDIIKTLILPKYEMCKKKKADLEKMLV